MASILVVCTGNICRSPLAEGFLRRALEERFGQNAPDVASAGTIGWEGSPAVAESIEAAAERNTDIRSHAASRLEPEQIIPAALVLGMTTEHRDSVAAMVPQAADRAFSLKELVSSPMGTLTNRVIQAAAHRRAGFAGNPHDEDIVDPLGMPAETFRAVAWEIDTLCEDLVRGLFGETSSVGASLSEEEAGI
jgi:protein-tyrosine phosphatase